MPVPQENMRASIGGAGHVRSSLRPSPHKSRCKRHSARCHARAVLQKRLCSVSRTPWCHRRFAPRQMLPRAPGAPCLEVPRKHTNALFWSLKTHADICRDGHPNSVLWTRLLSTPGYMALSDYFGIGRNVLKINVFTPAYTPLPLYPPAPLWVPVCPPPLLCKK